jgi:hypothetical protein
MSEEEDDFREIDDLVPSRPFHEMSEREITILTCERQAVANRRINSIHKAVRDHDRRLYKLEIWRAVLSGAWAVVVLFGGIMGKWVWGRLTVGHQ